MSRFIKLIKAFLNIRGVIALTPRRIKFLRCCLFFICVTIHPVLKISPQKKLGIVRSTDLAGSCLFPYRPSEAVLKSITNTLHIFRSILRGPSFFSSATESGSPHQLMHCRNTVFRDWTVPLPLMPKRRLNERCTMITELLVIKYSTAKTRCSIHSLWTLAKSKKFNNQLTITQFIYSDFAQCAAF